MTVSELVDNDNDNDNVLPLVIPLEITVTNVLSHKNH